MFFAMTTLPCYSEQRGLVILMVNFVLASIVLNFMLHNMTGRSFSVMQPTLLLLPVSFFAPPALERIIP